MKRVFLTVFLVQLTTSACAFDTLPLYKEEINEMTQDPKTRVIKGSEGDVSDLMGCQVDYELGHWVISKALSNINWDGEVWSRSSASISPSGMISEGGISLDYNRKNSNSFFVTKQLNLHPIYIGPWHYSPTIQKSIRFFAYYPKEGGNVSYQYESMTEKNKNIPEKTFSLSSTAKIAPDRFGLCVVKWVAKYGYNAIAETEKKFRYGFFGWLFRDYELVPTGKIIQAKE